MTCGKSIELLLACKPLEMVTSYGLLIWMGQFTRPILLPATSIRTHPWQSGNFLFLLSISSSFFFLLLLLFRLGIGRAFQTGIFCPRLALFYTYISLSRDGMGWICVMKSRRIPFSQGGHFLPLFFFLRLLVSRLSYSLVSSCRRFTRRIGDYCLFRI